MQKNILYPMQLSFSSQRSRNRLNTDLHEILPQIVLDYGSHFWAIFYISSNPLRFNRVGNKSTLKHPIHINFDPVKPVSIDMDVLNFDLRTVTAKLSQKIQFSSFYSDWFEKRETRIYIGGG